MIKITQALVDVLDKEIIKVPTKSLWIAHEFEIMDDSEFVLIKITVPDDSTEIINRKICSEVQKIVEPLVPERKDDYSWMCVVSQTGKVVASSFGGWAD